MLCLKTCPLKWDRNKNNIYCLIWSHQITPMLLTEDGLFNVWLCQVSKKIIYFCCNIIFVHSCASGSLVTGADYLPPPKGLPYLIPQKEPRSRYRYLDSDGALLRTPVWPIPSETKVWFYFVWIFLLCLLITVLLYMKKAVMSEPLFKIPSVYFFLLIRRSLFLLKSWWLVIQHPRLKRKKQIARREFKITGALIFSLAQMGSPSTLNRCKKSGSIPSFSLKKYASETRSKLISPNWY